jgi:5-methylcytosine-specific restriction enzyme A
MKVYKVTVDDELAATLERCAEQQQRAPSEMIAVMLRDWAFGVARRYPKVTDEQLARFRSRTTPRINIKARDRNHIFEPDGGKCRHCTGQLLYSEFWHIDHLVPLSKGGSNDIDNLALSCVRCNLEKSDKVAA